VRMVARCLSCMNDKTDGTRATRWRRLGSPARLVDRLVEISAA
jgi:hypothetical protein